ncbi:hypothetical protein ACHAP8_008843 [Fusarium lateritium]
MGELQSLVSPILVNSRSSLSTLPPYEQKPDCFLLNLPVVIVELINEHLPFSGRVCIRLTCLAMYYSLKSPAKPIEDEEWIECAVLVCRDRPDCWVAETRPYVRHMLEVDMPNPPKGSPVSENPFWSSEAVYLFERNTVVEAEHVQRAIKYSQLERKTWQQAEYLKLLLEPYQTMFQPEWTLGPRDEAKCYFQWYPKVVSANGVS